MDETEQPANDTHDEQVSQLLKSIDRDAAAVRPEVVDRVTQLAGDEFARSDVAPVVELERETSNADQRRRSKRRLLATISVAIVGACGLTLYWLGLFNSQISLGAVLEEMSHADMLQLRVTRDGETADVWV